jgi:hypothetical protein
VVLVFRRLRQRRENSGDGAYFSLGVLRRGTGRRGPLLRKLKIYKGRFWNRRLSLGGPFYETGRSLLTGVFEMRMKESSGNEEFISLGRLLVELGSRSFSCDPCFK